MSDIFKYTDYRKYLKDAFNEMKAARESFSHRSFAKMAGFSSSNYMLLVMQGKRNLSGEGVLKIAKALKLKKAEAEFFENLVRFGQAAGDAERNFYYTKIAANRKYAEARPLEKGQFEYYSKWFMPAIREMVLLKNFSEDPEWIASHLTPVITVHEAELSLKLLIELGFLVRDASGRLVQEDRHIASGDDVASLAMTNFQREMIERSVASVETTPANEREVGSITFAVSKEKVGEAKKMLREFRTKLAGFLAEESSADEVYQFNFQLFNLSQANGDKESKNEDK